jgi:DNA-binding MarR family transcriptional regulator
MNENIKTQKTMNLAERTKALAQSLLLLRKIQNKTEATFIKNLGNLNMQELNVLNTIGDQPGCTMSAIAKNLSLSLSSITVIVEKLVKNGLVTRIRSEEDRRIVYGRLTTAGDKIYQIQIEHLYKTLTKVLEKLSNNEQNNLINVMQKLTKNWS